MTSLPSKLLVPSLIAIALILGAALYQRHGPPLPFPLPRPPYSPPHSAPADDGAVDPDLDAVRRVPDQRASEEAKRAYYELINRLAVTASALEMTGCAAKPIILRVAEGNTITIRNADDIAHTMNIGQQKFTTPAKGAVMLTAKFDTGPGIYGYGCDTGLSIIGVLFVTP